MLVCGFLSQHLPEEEVLETSPNHCRAPAARLRHQQHVKLMNGFSTGSFFHAVSVATDVAVAIECTPRKEFQIFLVRLVWHDLLRQTEKVQFGFCLRQPVKRK